MRKWWEDDSVEFMFDFDNEIVRAALVQWTLGANGKDHSAAGFTRKHGMGADKGRNKIHIRSCY